MIEATIRNELPSHASRTFRRIQLNILNYVSLNFPLFSFLVFNADSIPSTEDKTEAYLELVEYGSLFGSPNGPLSRELRFE